MLNTDLIVIILCIFLCLNSLLIGYLIGRYSHNGVNNSSQSFFSKLKSDKIVNNTIAIDDKKFVIDIKTDNLEKKYKSLGEVKQTEENISDSVNKLKNLKG